MDGFVAVTDPGWYEHLSRTPARKRTSGSHLHGFLFAWQLERLSFSSSSRRITRLQALASFANFSVLPDWLAWETFGEANGVSGLAEFRSRLTKIQQHGRIASDAGGRIGCCLIAEAQFFQPCDWVLPPNTWSPRIQTGLTIDLNAGEGARIWQDCLSRSSVSHTTDATPPRFGSPVLHRPRLGQGIFRVQVLDAYGRACAVTGEHSLPVLDAAHIKPYAEGGEHDVTNGLSLRADLHRIFDKGYATVDENNRFVVGQRLKEDFENGRSYYGLHGQTLHLPADTSLHPAPAALGWHRDTVFLG